MLIVSYKEFTKLTFCALALLRAKALMLAHFVHPFVLATG